MKDLRLLLITKANFLKDRKCLHNQRSFFLKKLKVLVVGTKGKSVLEILDNLFCSCIFWVVRKLFGCVSHYILIHKLFQNFYPLPLSLSAWSERTLGRIPTMDKLSEDEFFWKATSPFFLSVIHSIVKSTRVT